MSVRDPWPPSAEDWEAASSAASDFVRQANAAHRQRLVQRLRRLEEDGCNIAATDTWKELLEFDARYKR